MNTQQAIDALRAHAQLSREHRAIDVSIGLEACADAIAATQELIGAVMYAHVTIALIRLSHSHEISPEVLDYLERIARYLEKTVNAPHFKAVINEQSDTLG